MLNFIKNAVAERNGLVDPEVQQIQEANTADAENSELILEYSHVFQELDELSMTGTPEDQMRPIDIPLTMQATESEVAGDDDTTSNNEDDDAEINNFELNVAEGLFTNIPLNAAIQEEYATMKTHDDFIEEAYDSISMEEGQTIEEYDNIVEKAAHKEFMEYRNAVLYNEAFGFGKLGVNTNDVVPARVEAVFSESCKVTLEPNFQVDPLGNMRMKQLESVQVMQEAKVLQLMEKDLTTFMESTYNTSDVWGNLEPVSMNVPIDPIDKHSVIVGFKNFANLGQMEYFRCSVPVLEAYIDPEVVSVPAETIAKMNMVSCTKNQAILESYNENPQFHHVIAEAAPAPSISDGPAPATPTTPAATPADPSMGAPISNDMTPPADPTQLATDTTAVPESTEQPTITVDSNDVSDQIAERIAQTNTVPDVSQSGAENASDAATDLDNIGNNMDLNADPTSTEGDLGTAPVAAEESDPLLDAGATGNADLGIDSSTDVDSAIASLDAGDGEGDTTDVTGTTADMDMAPTTEEGELDIDNMTLDDLVANGTEKLKGMTIGQLKDFLASDDLQGIQEAFTGKAKDDKEKSKDNKDLVLKQPTVKVDTNGTVQWVVEPNSKGDYLEAINTNIKSCLGVLNDSNLTFDEIAKLFKKYGKMLNKVLSSASKQKKMFTYEEINKMKSLNTVLTDLIMKIRPSKKNKTDIETTKEAIKRFTKSCKEVNSTFGFDKK